jgi:Autophagy protein Apg5
MNISASPDPVMIGSSNYEGKVPVTVTLAPTSLSSPTLPPPIHVLLPRSTYLHVGLSSVIQRLQCFAPPVLSFETGTVRTEPYVGGSSTGQRSGHDVENGNAAGAQPASASDAPLHRRNSIDATATATASTVPVCWFEDEETQMALRWHMFVGVLFDLRPPSPIHWTTSSNDRDDDNEDSQGIRPAPPSLPWRLRLHFNSYPSSQLLPLVGGTRPGSNVAAQVQASFKHSLKQALCLCTGSNRAALNLSRDAHGRLWEAIATNNFSLWRQVHEEGHNTPAFRGGNDASGSPVLIPVRLCCNSRPPIQRRCSPFRPRDHDARTNNRTSPLETCEAAQVTLGELMLSWLPEFFHQVDDGAGSSMNNNNNDSPAATDATTTSSTIRPKFRSVTWRVAGLSNLPMGTPLAQLWSHLSHPDHFLYICVVTTTAPASGRA